MTNKERLEEIKSRVWKEHCIYAVGDDSSREGYRYILSDEDFHWLMEQAERVQELESELNKQIEIGYKFEVEVYDLAKENKRYREALEFYADRENYKPDPYHYDPYIGEYISMIDYDNGATARQALEGEG